MTGFIILFSLFMLQGPERPLGSGIPSVEHVRGMAAAASSDSLPHAKLKDYGVLAFPAYEIILSDSKSEPEVIVGVLGVLADVEAPKGRFLPLALLYLTHTDSSVRIAAVAVVREIGGQKEASILIALLSDKDKTLVNQAASALAAIGGKEEVTAMDAWLRNGTAHRDDRSITDYVKKCRDELEKRLKENPIPKGSKN